MGSRGRSIRLRIYFLVAIPLITMLGLFGYVAYTSVTNWLNLDRAPSLIDATSEPLTNFVNVLQTERLAAMVYLSQPDSSNLATFQGAVANTRANAEDLATSLNSAASRDSSTPTENTAIAKMTGQIDNMGPLRGAVTAKKLSPLDALAEYTDIISTQGTVLEAEANSLTDAKPVEQGLGLIDAVDTQEDMSEQQALLASALASGSLTGAERVAFSEALGRQQDDTMTYQELFTQPELATYTATLNQLAPKQSVQANLTTIQEAVAAGTPLSQLEQTGLDAATWQGLTSTWMKASSRAGTETAVTVLAANSQPAVDAKRRVWITAAVGLAGLILTLIVTILLARSINRRLAALRRSALALAREQLPAVVARLRRGESVDVAAEAPPLRAGNDEIGQVGEAIDAVRQTAIRSAVEEAEVRQGVNDMFRNLARRNQSLLQRQLTVLDDMERRATDPDVLEDLFKMDHLTTRMRRHAEGLIILSGAPPGRSWSAPVKLVDVMRGAAAEVEDYARVTVSTQSRAALSGSAVTDVIHLLAELIENATTLSPPFTQIRVSGETVANGFAIEIEDRGLGMVPQRMQELNERLANPPDINPANTEQLGLFVVGQLGRRHGIRVVLRPSAYGGTTAVALLPLDLIVDEGPAAITTGGRGAPAVESAVPGPAGNGFAGSGPFTNGFAGPGGGGNGFAGNGAPRNGVGNGSFGNGHAPVEADAGSLPVRGRAPWTDANGWPAVGAAGAPAAGGPVQSGYPAPGPAGPPGIPPGAPASAGGYQVPPDTPRPAIRISGALRPPAPTDGYGVPGAGAAGAGPRRGRHGADDVPVVTGVPVGRPDAPPASPFNVFTPIQREEPGPGSYQEGPGLYQEGGPAPDGGGGDGDGLPRRVRQANLAPELRVSAAGSDAPAGAAVPPATAASLADMRNTLSAMQRGWQQGRSQTSRETEGNEADGS
jgi:signal transduction histidine kinase